MNKKKVEKLLPLALETLQNSRCGIAKDGTVKKAYRSAISSFGAAVAMGSQKAAAAFFSVDAEGGRAGIQRSRLLTAMDHLCSGSPDAWLEPDQVCRKILSCSDRDIKRLESEYLHAAVALKLAMNAFKLVS